MAIGRSSHATMMLAIRERQTFTVCPVDPRMLLSEISRDESKWMDLRIDVVRVKSFLRTASYATS